MVDITDWQTSAGKLIFSFETVNPNLGQMLTSLVSRSRDFLRERERGQLAHAWPPLFLGIYAPRRGNFVNI